MTVTQLELASLGEKTLGIHKRGELRWKKKTVLKKLRWKKGMKKGGHANDSELKDGCYITRKMIEKIDQKEK